MEDLLVIVILGKGDKEAGWAGTARKLAEDVDPGVSEIDLKSGLNPYST